MIESLLAVAALYFLYCYFSVKRISHCNTGSTAIASSHNSSHCGETSLYVPEDAVLRRHFITQLRSEIEAGLAPRPADSILQRHHETLVAAKLAQRLTELGQLQPC